VPNLLWEMVKLKYWAFHARRPTACTTWRWTRWACSMHWMPQAHVVGVSMGGMIAQRVALAAPQRVLSLTSIMSSSGARGLPEAKGPVLRAAAEPARKGTGMRP
jgi:pimeloyl-ACP methyl ester carboxylesterase